MISYPGEILRRFGRYEAVEELERAGTARLWGAWDPFLERFVIVVELRDVDPRELVAGLRGLDAALERWTDARVRGDEVVLDFDPGEGEEPAYFVIAADEEPAVDEEDGDDTRDEPADDDADQTVAIALPTAQRARDDGRDEPDGPEPPDETVLRALAAAPSQRPASRWAAPLLGAAAALLVGVGAGYAMRSCGGAAPPPAATTAPTALPTATRPPARAAAEPPAPAAPLVAGIPTGVPAPDAVAATATPQAAVGTARVTATRAVATPSQTRPAATRTPAQRAGRIQVDIAGPSGAVAVGSTISLRGVVRGISEAERARLDCVWLVNGTPRSRVCDDLALRIEPNLAPGPITITLKAQNASADLRVAVASNAPAAPANAAAPAAPPPTPAASGEAGPRAAAAAYVAEQQRLVRERTRKSEARCTLTAVSLRPAGAAWEATVDYAIDIPGQPQTSKRAELHIAQRGGEWVAEKR